MVTYFQKVKQKWTRIRKKISKWKQLESFGFHTATAMFEVYLPWMFRTCTAEPMKSCVKDSLWCQIMIFKYSI